MSIYQTSKAYNNQNNDDLIMSGIYIYRVLTTYIKIILIIFVIFIFESYAFANDYSSVASKIINSGVKVYNVNNISYNLNQSKDELKSILQLYIDKVNETLEEDEFITLEQFEEFHYNRNIYNTNKSISEIYNSETGLVKTGYKKLSESESVFHRIGDRQGTVIKIVSDDERREYVIQISPELKLVDDDVNKGTFNLYGARNSGSEHVIWGSSRGSLRLFSASISM